MKSNNNNNNNKSRGTKSQDLVITIIYYVSFVSRIEQLVTTQSFLMGMRFGVGGCGMGKGFSNHGLNESSVESGFLFSLLLKGVFGTVYTVAQHVPRYIAYQIPHLHVWRVETQGFKPK